MMEPHLDVKPMFVVIENFSCVFHCFFNDLHSSRFDSSVSILPWTTKCSSWCSSRRNVRAHLIVRRFGSWRIRPHPCHLKSPETWTLNAECFKFSPKITKIFPIDLPNCLFNAILGNERSMGPTTFLVRICVTTFWTLNEECFRIVDERSSPAIQRSACLFDH